MKHILGINLLKFNLIIISLYFHILPSTYIGYIENTNFYLFILLLRQGLADIAQAVLEFMIFLPPTCWNYRCATPHLA
jgi:hypothetical protein